MLIKLQFSYKLLKLRISFQLGVFKMSNLKDKAEAFLIKKEPKKTLLLEQYLDVILVMRDKGAKLKDILEFLMLEVKEIEILYKDKETIGISTLSRLIKSNKPKKEQKRQRNKVEERIITKEEPRAETIKEDVKTPSPVNEEIVAEKEDIFKLKPINKNDGLKVADKTNYK